MFVSYLLRNRILVISVIIVYVVVSIIISSVRENSLSQEQNPFGGRLARRQAHLNMPQFILRTSDRRMRLQWCQALKYQDPPGDKVALVSFPGSGNTWLRYLIQQATGIYTGSVYKDFGLLKNGFPAESISNGSVIVVKTHEWGEHARKAFDKAILLVRLPGPAIQAEFNRQSGGHIGFASPERYRRMKGTYWHKFVIDKLHSWKQTYADWFVNFPRPKHVIFYDELVSNVGKTLDELLRFLNVTVTAEHFRCTLERKEGIYRRGKRFNKFDPFSSELKTLLNQENEGLLNIFKKDS